MCGHRTCLLERHVRLSRPGWTAIKEVLIARNEELSRELAVHQGQTARGPGPVQRLPAHIRPRPRVQRKRHSSARRSSCSGAAKVRQLRGASGCHWRPATASCSGKTQKWGRGKEAAAPGGTPGQTPRGVQREGRNTRGK